MLLTHIRPVGAAVWTIGVALIQLLAFLGPRIWSVYRRWPTTAIGATGGCALMGLGLLPIFAAEPIRSADIFEAPSTASHRWIQIIKPTQVYSLQAPDLGNDPPHYEASRYGSGIGRKDVMTFGEFGAADRPWLRIRLYRKGTEPSGSESPDTLADLIGKKSLHVVSRESLDGAATRFGAMTTERATLLHDGEEPMQLGCLGFRIAVPQPAFEIDGVACETPDRLMNEDALTCLVDRLDLLSGASDEELRRYFAVVERLRRRECGRTGAARAPLDPREAARRKRERSADRKLPVSRT